MKPYVSYIPKTIGEIHELVGWMVLAAPKMEDDSGYFPGQSLETEFHALREGLNFSRNRIGEEKYAKLTELADRTLQFFKADPDDKTGDADLGLACLFEMEAILIASARRTKK